MSGFKVVNVSVIFPNLSLYVLDALLLPLDGLPVGRDDSRQPIVGHVHRPDVLDRVLLQDILLLLGRDRLVRRLLFCLFLELDTLLDLRDLLGPEGHEGLEAEW